MHNHAGIRWGNGAKNLNAVRNFVMLRDTYSFGTASM